MSPADECAAAATGNDGLWCIWSPPMSVHPTFIDEEYKAMVADNARTEPYVAALRKRLHGRKPATVGSGVRRRRAEGRHAVERPQLGGRQVLGRSEGQGEGQRSQRSH